MTGQFRPDQPHGPDTRQPRYMLFEGLPPAPTEPVVTPLGSWQTLLKANGRQPLGIVHDASGQKMDVMVNFGEIGSELPLASVVRREAIHEEDGGQWALVPGSGEGVDPDAVMPLDPHGNRDVTMDIGGVEVGARYRPLHDELGVGPAVEGDPKSQGFSVTTPIFPPIQQ